MKIKFIKPYLAYKSEQIETIEDNAVASDLIAKGYAVSAEDVDATAEAQKAVDAAFAGSVERMSDAVAVKAMEKVAKNVKAGAGRIVVGPANIENDPRGGFKSLGEFALAVKRMSTNMGIDERLKPLIEKAASTNGNTDSNASPAVPVEYTNQVFQVSGIGLDLFAMTRQYPASTSSLKVPVYSRYNLANTTFTAGVVGSWIGESQAIPQSQSVWEQVTLTLNKMAVLVPVSEELLEDNNVALDAVLAQDAAFQIKKDINTAIIKGTGTGQPTGILGHASVKSVAKDVSQTAATITFGNIANMYAAFNHDGADYNNAIWLMHPTAFAQIIQLTSGNYNVFTAPGGAINEPNGRLFGRPVYLTADCAALGTVGDIILADMKSYLTAYKGGLQSAVSIHLFFDAQQTAFRWTMRVAGRPGPSTVVTLQDGSTTVSSFVTVQTRS